MTRAADAIALGTHVASPMSVGRAPAPAASDRPHGSIDYDVHGLLGLRLVDPAPADLKAFEWHLRGFRQPLTREPDLVVRFVERLTTAGLRCVDVDRNGFDEDGFLVRGGARAGWVRIPFERLGAPCELVSERGTSYIPYLKSVLRLVALQRGYVPVHGSAFACGDVGVLVTGWTHGGKTSALLAFAERGARFVGDDLVLLTADGRRMFGLSTPLNVSIAQLRQSRRLSDAVRRRQRVVLEGLEWLDRTEDWLAPRWPRGARSLDLLRRAMRPVRRRFGVRMPPERAFWSGIQASAEPRRLFLMMSHRRPDVSVERADPMDVVERMIHSLRYEDLGLLGEYSAFRFAFPEPQRANELLERAHHIARTRLRGACAGLEAYVVRHPYPPPLQTLHDVMHPLCEGDPANHVAT